MVRKESGGKFQPEGSGEPIGKSATQTAQTVGTSESTVKRVRNVLSDPEEKEAVLAGSR